ncbi:MULTISPECIES: SGNH/GDSL hydrolase family protein [unclassified Mesobacillus]|uniref:SGNH/GDSL hydrolase family protein n=1 Tax=unclassified Mesobacillus TaxID=2675270 RepID=UPI00203D6351|nr:MULTISPECIES: SGNH/GDSL hydrolase family protein [unclassified Mesobacillus]MCM3124188.1 SGNH/GDSL hydrolase family protein [Mesobacillus sp. MER 33]MCM3234037.1 SGNH/GDSL hydrolase family protein [Mesobacillus sp. MER 48]
MKHILVICLTFACSVILILGNQHWKEKIKVTAYEDQSNFYRGAKDETEPARTDFFSYTKNWPEEAQLSYKQSINEKKLYKILIAGSTALGPESSGWAYLLKNKLKESFHNTLDVSVKSYDLTSTQIIEEGKDEELAAEKADLILLEPFILKDNGKVTIENSNENINKVIESIKTTNKEAIVLLQPANPLYQAKYYPLQVEALKEYADRNNISYINHWDAWPDPQSEEIKNFLIGEPSTPNENGHMLWADYLIDYFIAE